MKTKKATAFDYVLVLIFVLICFIMIIPIYKVLIDSLDLRTAYGMKLFPEEFGLAGYESVFTNPTLYRPFLVSCLTTVAGTFCGLAISTLGAYVLIQWNMPGRNFFCKPSALYNDLQWWYDSYIPGYEKPAPDEYIVGSNSSSGY